MAISETVSLPTKWESWQGQLSEAAVKWKSGPGHKSEPRLCVRRTHGCLWPFGKCRIGFLNARPSASDLSLLGRGVNTYPLGPCSSLDSNPLVSGCGCYRPSRGFCLRTRSLWAVGEVPRPWHPSAHPVLSFHLLQAQGQSAISSHFPVQWRPEAPRGASVA